MIQHKALSTIHMVLIEGRTTSAALITALFTRTTLIQMESLPLISTKTQQIK